MTVFLAVLGAAMVASIAWACAERSAPEYCATCGKELPGDLQGDCEHLASHIDTRPVVDRAMPYPD